MESFPLPSRAQGLGGHRIFSKYEMSTGRLVVGGGLNSVKEDPTGEGLMMASREVTLKCLCL